MAARIEPLMTVDDLDAMPEDGNRYEVIEGELFVSRAPGVPHQRVTKNAIFVFESYLIENPIGEIIPTPGLILAGTVVSFPISFFILTNALRRSFQMSA
jgi:Uma2 family endonuclease